MVNFNFPENISIFLKIRYLENLLFAPTDTNIVLLLFYFGFSQCQSGRVVKGACRLLDVCCSDSVGSNPTNSPFCSEVCFQSSSQQLVWVQFLILSIFLSRLRPPAVRKWSLTATHWSAVGLSGITKLAGRMCLPPRFYLCTSTTWQPHTDFIYAEFQSHLSVIKFERIELHWP